MSSYRPKHFILATLNGVVIEEEECTILISLEALAHDEKKPERRAAPADVRGRRKVAK